METTSKVDKMRNTHERHIIDPDSPVGGMLEQVHKAIEELHTSIYDLREVLAPIRIEGDMPDPEKASSDGCFLEIDLDQIHVKIARATAVVNQIAKELRI